MNRPVECALRVNWILNLQKCNYISGVILWFEFCGYLESIIWRYLPNVVDDTFVCGWSRIRTSQTLVCRAEEECRRWGSAPSVCRRANQSACSVYVPQWSQSQMTSVWPLLCQSYFLPQWCWGSYWSAGTPKTSSCPLIWTAWWGRITNI